MFVIPDLEGDTLPPGVHDASWQEIDDAFGHNPLRQQQLEGLRQLALALGAAGCQSIWLDGSFVSSKERPGDFDACWDWVGVDPSLLDPLLIDPRPRSRAAAKAKYLGDIFVNVVEGGSGLPFVEFFQQTRDGHPKGIVRFNPQEVQ